MPAAAGGRGGAARKSPIPAARNAAARPQRPHNGGGSGGGSPRKSKTRLAQSKRGGAAGAARESGRPNTPPRSAGAPAASDGGAVLDMEAAAGVEIVLGRLKVSDRKVIKKVQDVAVHFVEDSAAREALLDWKEREDGQRYKFHHLCFAGDEPGQVKMLIQDGLAPLAALTEGGQTPLHWAALGGHLQVIDLLLAGGADPCAVDKRGLTALHMAAGKGYAAVLAALLGAGAVRVIDNQAAQMRDTALVMAASCGHLDCVKVLRRHGADIGLWSVTAENVVDVARRFGHQHVAEFLLEDMEAADKANYLAMLRAAEERHRRLMAEIAARYAAERVARHEAMLAWITADKAAQTKRAAEAELRRKEAARIAREMQERHAREYGSKSRKWARQSQERRAQFEMLKQMEKERLLCAELDVERQIRMIWRRRTRARTRRADLLRRRMDERGTRLRDEAFAAETDGRDITRQREHEHVRGAGFLALPVVEIVDGLPAGARAGTAENSRCDSGNGGDDVTVEEAKPPRADEAAVEPAVAPSSGEQEGRRRPPQRALTASAMLMASVGGAAFTPPADGIIPEDALPAPPELTEEEQAAAAAAEAEAAAAAAAAEEARRAAAAAAAARAAFHAVVMVEVQPPQPAKPSAATEGARCFAFVGRPPAPADLPGFLATQGGKGEGAGEVWSGANGHRPHHNRVNVGVGVGVGCGGGGGGGCGGSGGDHFATCAASRARDPRYRAAVRDHLKWRELNQSMVRLRHSALVGTSPVLAQLPTGSGGATVSTGAGGGGPR